MTAIPRFKQILSAKDLAEITPTPQDRLGAHCFVKGRVAEIDCLCSPVSGLYSTFS